MPACFAIKRQREIQPAFRAPTQFGQNRRLCLESGGRFAYDLADFRTGRPRSGGASGRDRPGHNRPSKGASNSRVPVAPWTNRTPAQTEPEID